ncbi:MULTISPECIES: sodium:solute symporter family transporter [unclassified Luteimonas]
MPGWSRPGVMLALLLALMASAMLPVHAEGVVETRETELPRLPAGANPASLALLAGQVVATGDGAAWALAPDATAWRQVQLPDDAGAQLLASVGQGARAYRLMGDQQLQRIEDLSWSGDRLVASELPMLPEPLRAPRAAVLGDSLHVAGLDEDGRTRLWVLATAGKGSWRSHDGWPGDGAPQALVAQKAALYLAAADGALWRWTADAGWSQRGELPGPVVRGQASPIGQAHLLYLLASPVGEQPRLFHVITDAWSDWPGTTPSTSAGLARGNGVLWAGADGSLVETRLHGGKHLLRTLDWVVIVVYLAAMLAMGFWFYFRDRNESTSDFFVGGRSIPFWAAGISLYATNTSSISFIAIPAKAFDTNWQYMTNNLMAVVGLTFVAVWIVPLLRRLDLMSVFSYLETRFHPAIRMLSSALCIVMQVGARMSVILFLPALAISTITGLDVVWSILMMGVFTIIYSTVGGSKAVIWTDVVQVVVMFGGALFAVGFIFWHSGADLPQLMDAAAAQDKTKLLDFSFDLTKATVWGFIFLVLFDVVLTFPKDQVLMQRTLSTKDDKAAGRSIWAFAAIMIPGGVVFYGIGTALWMYYRNNPERLNPLLPIDATFPLFIAAELPSGVTGLIIAGIFAAAMSTLSSIINSVGTLVSVDFYQKLAKAPNEKTSVRVAEWAGVMVGVAGILIALVMSRYDIQSLFDVSIEMAGLLGGGFAGAYTLGMFTRRANSPGVAIGVAGSIVITVVCWTMDLVHPYFYLAISIALCIVIGYIASLFFPPPSRSLEGLTIYTPAPG